MNTCDFCQSRDHCLSKVNLFKELGVDESKSIYLTAKHVDYEKNQRVFSLQEPIDKILIVRYGKIKTLIYDEEGRENILKIYLPGDIIGEDSIFLEKSYEADGLAIEKTGLCQVDKDTLRQILVTDINFSTEMIKNLSQKLYESEKLLEILSIKDAYKRLAAFLAYRSSLTKTGLVELNQENIASSINMSRETVSRKLSQLEEAGYIELLAYKKIKIKNLPGLINLKNN
ncbi:MAG: Crp/Fnr family transcriptional regulator [Bacillota bacterium]|nr:Crp/Fnr family transcriptional regulator [Bacillota bacterium]